MIGLFDAMGWSFVFVCTCAGIALLRSAWRDD